MKTKVYTFPRFGWQVQLAELESLNGWSFSIMKISFGALFCSSLLTVGWCEGRPFGDILWISGIRCYLKAKKNKSYLTELR